MTRQKTVLGTICLIVFTIGTCIGCNSSGDTGTVLGPGSSLLQDSTNSGVSPTDAGEGFVFAVAGRYSNDPLGIIDVSFVAQGETPSVDVLHIGSVRHPIRNINGSVTVTESCFTDESAVIEYRRISVLTEDGGTSPLTPCSYQISTPGGFTWIYNGRLSPNGQRLAAQIGLSGEPPISVVFENGQEIARYSGFGLPAWLNDDSLVMVGSKIVTARLGQEPIIVSDDVSGLSISTLAVSPDRSQLVFEWDHALWLMNIDGSGLRELLPANRYIFPTWSPDGRWVATMQQQALTANEVTIGISAGFLAYTNLPYFTIVNVENGAQLFADVSMHLYDSQMPQGGLSWY